MPGDTARDHLERGQAAVRKDMCADEAPRGLLHRVGAVIDDDRLQQHAPSPEKARAALEERVEIAPADRLDHLDRDELVVAPAQIAIVLAENSDPIVDPGRVHPRLGVLVLLARDRGGRDLTAPRFRGVHGEAAPSRADLEHMVVRAVGGAGRTPARAWRWRPPRASSLGAESTRRSTSWSHRASTRRTRCRGRSGPRCCGDCARACCVRGCRAPSGAGSAQAPGGGARRRGRVTLRAATRTTAVRSGDAHSPSM